MHDVFLAKKAARAVQYESMQAILEPVGVKKTEQESAEHARDGVRKKPKGESGKRGTGRCGRQEIVPLDSQPLGFRLGANYFIRSHSEDRVTPAPICRKRTSGRPCFSL